MGCGDLIKLSRTVATRKGGSVMQEVRIASKRGVYFIASDGVIENTIAFLNSFRQYNPEINLCLVPYNDSIDQICALQEEYHFSVWRDAELFSHCDRMSKEFHGEVYGHYRKIAIWNGPFDEFIYIDTDTVVLRNIDFAFSYLENYEVVTSHSNIPSIRKWVWKKSIDQVKELTQEQIQFAANTGFIASRAGNLSVAKALQMLPQALRLVKHMELSCMEQPFLNYLFVSTGMRYTSLSTLFRHTGDEKISLERWGGYPLKVEADWVVKPSFPPTLLVHWAGEWRRAATEGTTIYNYPLWEHYRFLRQKPIVAS